MTVDWRQRTREVAKKFGIDPEIFYRQIRQESADFAPDVIDGRRKSSAGAIGIAQIIPRYHPTVNPLDPEASLNYAAKWISDMLKSGKSIVQALASYNWGPERVAQWDGRRETLPAETRTYLDIILGKDWKGTAGGGSITLPGGIEIQLPRLPEIPSADTAAQYIWSIFDGLRKLIHDKIMENARSFAEKVGGPVVFWVVGQSLIGFGLLGLALSGLGMLLRSKPAKLGIAAVSLAGPPGRLAAAGAEGVAQATAPAPAPAQGRGMAVARTVARGAKVGAQVL